VPPATHPPASGAGAAWVGWARSKSCSPAFTLSSFPPSLRAAKLEDIIALDDLAKGASDVEQYMADVNSGFTPTLEFTIGDDGKNKIALTEKSSKTLSHHRTTKL
jgi:hypothetical protein